MLFVVAAASVGPVDDGHGVLVNVEVTIVDRLSFGLEWKMNGLS